MQNCLREKRALLTWDCQEQLFRQEMENSDDLRLSVRLFKSCLADKRKVCSPKKTVFLPFPGLVPSHVQIALLLVASNSSFAYLSHTCILSE